MSSKSSKVFEGLLPRAFARPPSASRKPKKAVQEGDDNAEVAFSIPPSVRAALTRCAAQSRERVARGSAAAAGGGRGNAHLAASARSGGFRPPPVTPSLTPYATEHISSTVSASSEDSNKCCFFTAASANGGEGSGSGGLVSGKGGSSPGERRNGDAGVAVCDVHLEEDSKGGIGVFAASQAGAVASLVGGSGEGIDGRRKCHAPEAPTGGDDEPLLGRPSGKNEPMGSGEIDKALTEMFATAGGSAVNERRDNLRTGGVPCVSTPCNQDAGGDCCARSYPGSSGGIAAPAAAAAAADDDGDGNDQRKLWRFSSVPTPTTGVSMSDLEAALGCAEKAPKTKKSSQVLLGMSEKSKAVSKVAMSPFRRKGKSTSP